MNAWDSDEQRLAWVKWAEDALDKLIKFYPTEIVIPTKLLIGLRHIANDEGLSGFCQLPEDDTKALIAKFSEMATLHDINEFIE